MVHVPFRGAGPAAQAVLAGQIQVASVALAAAEPLVKSGDLRALAVTGDKRWFSLPDVPTMIESGYPGFVSDTFNALFAPAGTPPEIIAHPGQASRGGHAAAGGDRRRAQGRLPNCRQRPRAIGATRCRRDRGREGIGRPRRHQAAKTDAPRRSRERPGTPARRISSARKPAFYLASAASRSRFHSFRDCGKLVENAPRFSAELSQNRSTNKKA